MSKTTTQQAHSAAPHPRILLRLVAVAGFLITASFVALGFSAFSPFTYFAVAALPSPILFLAAVFRPTILTRSRRLRVYLLACVAASALCLALELYRLSKHVS